MHENAGNPLNGGGGRLVIISWYYASTGKASGWKIDHAEANLRLASPRNATASSNHVTTADYTTTKWAIGPVPVGTGCNSSWYLWPSTDLVEGNWHRVVVPTGSNASP